MDSNRLFIFSSPGIPVDAYMYAKREHFHSMGQSKTKHEREREKDDGAVD